MKHTSKTLLFFGNERLSTGFEPDGAPTLQALLAAGYEIKAVVAHHTETQSRNRRELEIEAVAQVNHIPVLLPAAPVDIISKLAEFGADAAVLVAYGKMIPQAIIDLFPYGIINIHPSLLPLYRGSTPIEQALRDGAPKTGISLMQLVHEMDAGPVFAQQEIALNGTETKQALTTQLLGHGAQLLIHHLPAILDGSLIARPQTAAHASYTNLITKADAWLDLTKPADILECEVRAFASWPKSKLELYEKTIIITRSRIATNKQDGALVIACAHDTFLEIQELIAPSGKKMTGAAFLRGI